jgi:flagellar hook-associated protein 1 FlgK
VPVFGTAFQIGRSALAAYQASIAITGQNISNVGNPNYTRQSGHLAAAEGGLTLAGVSPGTGVNLNKLQRHVDEALEIQLRNALSQRNGALTTYETLNRIEGLYGELTDDDLSSQLSDMFASFTNLQTDPTEDTARDLVISDAKNVISTMRRQRNGLLTEITDLNNKAVLVTEEANEIAEEVARLNALVVSAQARGQGGDGALRDRRDAMLRDLADLIEIDTREHENGMVNVYINSQPLVEFDRSRGLHTEKVLTDGLERTQVRFTDNNGPVTMTTGRLAAIVETRDVYIERQLNDLDSLAQAIIYEVNRVHTTGRGLAGQTDLYGVYALDSATVALNVPEAGLTYPVKNGAFLVHVREKLSGQEITRMVQIDLDGLNGNDTTLTGLAAQLNALPNLNATVTADNRLHVTTNDGYEVSFSDDTSGVLAAVGIGTFFDGTTATSMQVNAAVAANPNLIATSLTGAAGDGGNAGRLALTGTSASAVLNGRSIQEFHEQMVHNLGVDTAAAQTTYEAMDAVYSSLQSQREAVSGVSLDEETINLTMYERSFQGASRYVSVVNDLSAEVMNLVASF